MPLIQAQSDPHSLIKNDVTHIKQRAVALERVDRLVGNTPLVRLRHLGVQKGAAPIYLKMEDHNPSGSIRDRYMAEVLQRSVDAGQTMAGDEVAIAGLDDSAVSAALLGAQLGLVIHVFAPQDAPQRLRSMLEQLGARLHWTEAGGGVACAVEEAVRWTHERPSRMFIHGFRREAVRDAYRAIADEILLAMRNREIGSFITSVSTGGTFREVAPYLRESHPTITVAGAVLLEMEVERLRQHPSDILERISMERAWEVRDLVARREGMLLSPKGAACVAMALALQPHMPEDAAIIALNPDAGPRYIGWEHVSLFGEPLDETCCPPRPLV